MPATGGETRLIFPNPLNREFPLSAHVEPEIVHELLGQGPDELYTLTTTESLYLLRSALPPEPSRLVPSKPLGAPDVALCGTCGKRRHRLVARKVIGEHDPPVPGDADGQDGAHAGRRVEVGEGQAEHPDDDSRRAGDDGLPAAGARLAVRARRLLRGGGGDPGGPSEVIRGPAPGAARQEAERGMAEKSREFLEKGAEIYLPEVAAGD